MSESHWRKNLYENTHFEDNYTDPSFLQELRTNINVYFFTFTEAFKGATLLNNQISCITGFLILFYMLYNGHVNPTVVLLCSGGFIIIGYLLFNCKGEFRMQFFIEDCKTIIAVLVFGYIFAPVLHKLTDTISTDTIFSMTFVSMILNLIFFDYGLSVAMTSKTLSLNAAVFGSICLASRLSTSYHAFVLVIVAVLFFVIYPIFTTTFWQPYILLPLFLFCCYFLFKISYTVFWIYVTVTISINFICPWIFVKQQRYKDNIHGPWDEAIVEENHIS